MGTPTTGDDYLSGTIFGDLIDGLAGNDLITGLEGNDVLRGGPGMDLILGGAGDDVLEGGDGDDNLADDIGSDTFRGGDGNDTISTHRDPSSSFEQIRIEGGAGNDEFSVRSLSDHATFSVEMGTGDDRIDIYALSGPATITLGLGSDVITLEGETRWGSIGTIVITDFAVGDPGDAIRWDAFLGQNLAGWDQNSNPFGNGFLRLVQDGTTTLIQIDRDGTASGYSYATLISLQNVDHTSLTQANLGGLPGDGSAIVGIVSSGTTGDDTINGTLGADVLDGGLGNDVLLGSGGNDSLRGGSGLDVLVGGRGDDLLEGGDGDDNLSDDSGSDTLRGGDGNDTINVNREASTTIQTIHVEGGAGNDELSITLHNNKAYLYVDMGGGDDRVDIYSLVAGNFSLMLGDGSDTVVLEPTLVNTPGLGDTVGLGIYDFVAGPNGDQLEWDAFLSAYLIGWDASTNPFATGFLRLIQDGDNTLIQVDRDANANGVSYTSLIGLQEVNASTLTAQNLGGHDGNLQSQIPHDPNNDFNGDGRSDVLWRNDNGGMTDWLGTNSGGFSPNGANLLTVVDPSWQIAATGDFDGDHRDDVMFRRADGALTDWLGTATGGLAPNGANLLEVVDAQWQIAGVGDFNGDGRDDVLWHRGDGALTDWLGTASGGLAPNGGNLLQVVDPQWQVAGVGDFNGDGKDDVLWHRGDGALTDWLGTSTGGLTPNGGNLLEVVAPQWQIAGVGDFNGDGKDDVLWRRSDGALTDWLGTAIGGLTPNGANLLTVVSTDWQVAAIGDYNGDGRDDILWRNADGRMTDWLGTAAGGFTDNLANAYQAVDTHWHVQPHMALV